MNGGGWVSGPGRTAAAVAAAAAAAAGLPLVLLLLFFSFWGAGVRSGFDEPCSRQETRLIGRMNDM